MPKDKKEILQEGYQPKKEIIKKGYQPEDAEDSSSYTAPTSGTAAKTTEGEGKK